MEKEFYIKTDCLFQWKYVVNLLLKHGYRWFSEKEDRVHEEYFRDAPDNTIISVRGSRIYWIYLSEAEKMDTLMYTVGEFILKMGIVKKYKIRRIICRQT